MTREFRKYIAAPTDLVNRHAIIQQLIDDIHAVEIKEEDFPVEVPAEQIFLATQKRNLILSQQADIVSKARADLEKADEEHIKEYQYALDAAIQSADKEIEAAEQVLISDLERAGEAAKRQSNEKYQAALQEKMDAVRKAESEFNKLDRELSNYGDQPMTEDEIAEFLERETEYNLGTYQRDLDKVLALRKQLYELFVDPLTMEANRTGEQAKFDEANAMADKIKEDNPKPNQDDYTESQGGTKKE